MNAPDPKANTTTEAYLAYKAGYLEESELKPVLYEPYLHFDAWLAYWAGLTTDYPVTISKKNLFDISKVKTNSTTLVNNGDGTLTVNTPAGSSSVGSAPPNKLSDFCPDLKVGDTATLSLKTTGTEKYIYLYGTGANVGWASGVSRTITQAMLDAQVLWYASGVNTSAIISNVQLELGTTSSEYEPYSTPEMLTDEEALVAYLAGVTDTYPEDIKDPYDVRIVGYLKHLASIRWPEPDYPVNNEEFYLSTMEPTHTSNSEPSADIELETAEGKIISVEAYGDTKQQTYSGKNLLDIPDGYTGTSGGVTTTWSNNIATSNASSTTSTTCTLTSTLAFESTIPAGTYTFSVQSSTSQYYPILRLRDTSDTWHNYSITAGENSVTITTDYSANAAQLSLGLWTAGTAITNFVTEYPMLEVGQSATSYEPYTGGVPSPNPDYPQTVNVVTGTQTVTVNGKNLFDRANAVENMILGWANANDVTENGSLVAHEYMLVSEGDTFASNYGMCVFFFDSNDNYLGCLLSGGTTIGKQTGTYVRTFTVPSGYGIAKMKIEYRHNLGGNPSDMTSVTDIMLNTGNRVLPYEPYQSYTVDLGATELCKIGDYQDYIYKSGDDWYVHKDIGKTIVTGDSSESWLAQANNVGYMYRLALADVGSVPAGEKANLLSDYFTPTTSGVIYNATSGGYISQLTTPGYIRFSIGDATNKLSEFRTWLSTHNTTVYYALATPTDTKITDSTLIGQLDALAGADTYDGKTYIKVTANDPNLPALLKVEAYKY